MPSFKTLPKTLDTNLGKLTGLVCYNPANEEEAQCIRYAGIPYAKPPTGELRWKRPVALPDDFDYSGDYSDFGFLSPQPIYPGNSYAPSVRGEDCLKLNIWTPLGEPPEGGWPVWVYIHGGWLQIGSAMQYEHGAINDGFAPTAPSGPCVFVAMTYRLSLFGFLTSKELLAEDPGSSNFGFWDQRAAIEWTYKNIAAFGGNPENVTLSGLSAGSYSTIFQFVYEAYHPEATQIIKRIFCQSNGLVVQPKSIEECEHQYEEVLDLLNIPRDIPGKEQLKLLRAIPAEEIQDKILNLKTHTFRAVTDGDFVPESLLEDIFSGRIGELAGDRTFLIGEVENEGYRYSLTLPPKDKADLRVQLINYYPEKIVDAFYPHMYPDVEDKIEAVHQLFGEITGDLQIYVSSRIFIRGLLKGGVPPSKIYRYSIAYRGKFYDAEVPLWVGLTHAGDIPIWHYQVRDRWTPQELKFVYEWMAPFKEFLNEGTLSEWGTKDCNEIRFFEPDGSITVKNDDRWDFAMKVGGAIAQKMEIEF